MTKVENVLAFLQELAPPELAMDFDNVGLLLGRESAPVTRILTALDITDDVIGEAAALKAELIVAHHPLFFDIKRIVDTEPVGKKILALASAGISAICMHTNLDVARGGVNDALAAALGLRVEGELNEEQHVSRLCSTESETAFSDFMRHTCAALCVNGLRYHDAGRPVRVVGVCGGSGGQDLELAHQKGCDTYVSADIKHHQFILAKELNINLIDAGHFPTENVVIPILAEKLAAAFPETEVKLSRLCSQTEKYFVK